MSFDHPIEQSVLLPFVLSGALAGAFRLLPFPAWHKPLGAASVGLAFLAVTAAVFGLPMFPPSGALHKLPYLVAFGVLVGLPLDRWRISKRARRVVIGLWLLVALAWLAMPRFGEFDVEDLLAVGCSFIAAAVVLARVDRLHGQHNVGLALVGAASVGLAGVAMIGASASLFQLAIALFFALAGFAPWNRSGGGDSYTGSVLLIGGGGTLLILGAQMALFSTATPWAVGVLLLVFLADVPARRWSPTSGPWRHRLLPAYAFLAGLVPVGLALLIAFLAAGADDAYY